MNSKTEDLNQQLVAPVDQPVMESPPSTGDMLFQDGMLEQLEKFSIMMAKGKSTIPAHLQGNQADCMAIVMQSAQWKMNPFSVAQKTHLIKGTLGYEAQLVNAVITAMASTKERIRYEWFGDWSKVIGNFKTVKGQNGKSDWQAPNWNSDDEKSCGVKVCATFKGEDEPRVLELLLSQATVRNSTLWASDPKQQLAYLGVKRWSRLYCPDVIMGVYTPDELEQSPRSEKDITPVVDDLNRKLNDEKIKTFTENIKGAKSIEALSVIGKVIANEPSEVQDKVRGPYDKKIKALKAAAKKDEKTAAAAETAITEGAPSYPEIMDMINKAKESADIESALSMASHLPEDQQTEIQRAGGNALEGMSN